MARTGLVTTLVLVIVTMLALVFVYDALTKSTSDEGNGDNDKQTGDNKQPIARFSVSSNAVRVGESVTFFGGESFDPDGWISGYVFSFGDGTESGLIIDRSVTHVYDEVGNYSAKLMVIDDKSLKSGWSDEVVIVVTEVLNLPPTARLEVKKRALVNESVLFDASDSRDPEGAISSYIFDFGDGNSTGAIANMSVIHSYSKPGIFNVSLQVIDNKALASLPVYAEINITTAPPPENQAPIARLRPSATKISVNGTIEFDGSGSFDPDGTIAKYFFRFTKDLEYVTTEPKANYTYRTPGEYIAMLMVEDDDGLQSAWVWTNITVRVDGMDLSPNYIVLVEEPDDEEARIFVTSLSTFAVHNGYHPLFILEEGDLSEQQMSTIESMNATDTWTTYLFSDNVTTIGNVMSHGLNLKVLSPDIHSLEQFNGFAGNVTVASFEESLWAAPIASLDGKLVFHGARTYSSQEASWEALSERGIRANYVVVTNPSDNGSFGSDEMYHIPSLSLVAGELAAYRHAYVLTSAPQSTEQIAPTSLLDASVNARAIGIYTELKKLYNEYGPTEYVALVGSAPAVPQFLFKFDGEGDDQVSSDCAYGFLDDNMSTMDVSVGRIINYNVGGASNMLARTFGYSMMNPLVTVDFTREGPQVVNWSAHGASISGMQITWQRHQATPGFFLCEDYADEGIDYDYMGPSGMTIGDELVTPTLEPDAKPIFQSSAFVGYRGHGTSDSSAIGIGVYGSPYGTLYGRDFRNITIPPQVGMFAACENAKIYGLDYGGLTMNTTEMFAPNYMYSGAVAMVGSTEVSYSNPHQDIFAIEGRTTGNHYWDKNNAYFAFFWDGILDHEALHGSVGEALRWAHNRYIAYHGYVVNPFNCSSTLDQQDWKEIIEYVLYGDPAFVPWQPKPGNNSVDEWHNGVNEGMEINKRAHVEEPQGSANEGSSPSAAACKPHLAILDAFEARPSRALVSMKYRR